MPAIRPGARGAVISGWGTALPEKIVTNDELAATMDTSDEWIQARTGIKERRIGGTTIGLSVDSGRQALEMAGLEPSRIDALVLSTTTPDWQWGNAAAVQNELDLFCGAFDVNAACSGFVYALVTAHGLVAMGADRVLVIGTDTLSRITDWDDRATAPLFADGSGAVVIESVDGPGQLLGWDLDADGSALPILQADVGGTIKMEGQEVFRRAVRIMVDSAEKSMLHAGVHPEEVKLVVPHQANIRIIQAACDRLGIPIERAAVVIDTTGNTSSASIPLAMADALETGRVQNGDLLLLVGFGGGMTAASCVLRWGGGVE
ncbi:MAG: beta-ketoacyl-ACP synthase 3 [Ilumatobacter sp.]|uniref:beta-ketoacyl-ACP synthase 3 n=1 Tax=Ilumatobacter sp. TaxID=1967498 RepID=UPI002604B1A4|nr:beta-ketoacyl-ACP synthase 3 [Ilumatobacter sp.]MDJ0771122.1 beta-ketoacyl-ACP synthase 3 [Ilumatobacter sp.]